MVRRFPNLSSSGQTGELVERNTGHRCCDAQRLTLIEIDGHMPRLWEREHADKLVVFFLQLLSHRGELVLCEEPMPPLRRLPVVGGHGCGDGATKGTSPSEETMGSTDEYRVNRK